MYTGLTYTLNLSTTTKAVDGLDLLNWNANVGADSELFAQSVLSGPAAAGELTFAGNPFLYDPSLGNLLLTIVVSGTPDYTGETLFFDSRNGTAAGQTSRAMFTATGGPICCGNNDYGLTTTFTTVPEPSCAALAGFLILIWASKDLRRSAFSGGMGHRR